MVHLFKLLLLSFLLVGCSNDDIDVGFLWNETEVQQCEPVQCEETIYGQLTEDWVDRVDTTRVKLNHYVNEVKIEENLADVVDVNGKLATSNPITIPEYVGEPMKHILIIEFWQVR